MVLCFVLHLKEVDVCFITLIYCTIVEWVLKLFGECCEFLKEGNLKCVNRTGAVMFSWMSLITF